MHREGFLGRLIWIMRKVMISGYQFRWSGGAFVVTHRMISKDAPVWQCRGLVFLHEPFSSQVTSYSDIKNLRGVTSHILVSLHGVQQPTKQATVSCGYQSQSFSSFFFFFFFSHCLWHLPIYVKCYRLLSSWKVTLRSQNKTAKLHGGSRNECLWISWAGDWDILPGANRLWRKNVICRKYNVNSLLLFMTLFFEKLLMFNLVLQFRAAPITSFVVLEER